MFLHLTNEGKHKKKRETTKNTVREMEGVQGLEQ